MIKMTGIRLTLIAKTVKVEKKECEYFAKETYTLRKIIAKYSQLFFPQMDHDHHVAKITQPTPTGIRHRARRG